MSGLNTEAASKARAEHGSVAIGGNVSNSTVQIGLDEAKTAQLLDKHQEPILERLSAITDQIAREKGVPVEALRVILGRLGESGFSDFQIPERLEALADELLRLRVKLGRSELAPIREQALALIDQGDFDGARIVIDRCGGLAREQRGALSGQIDYLLQIDDLLKNKRVD